MFGADRQNRGMAIRELSYVLLRDPDEGPARPVIRSIRRPALAALVLSGGALVATSVMPQLLLGLLD